MFSAPVVDIVSGVERAAYSCLDFYNNRAQHSLNSPPSSSPTLTTSHIPSPQAQSTHKTHSTKTLLPPLFLRSLISPLAHHETTRPAGPVPVEVTNGLQKLVDEFRYDRLLSLLTPER